MVGILIQGGGRGGGSTYAQGIPRCHCHCRERSRKGKGSRKGTTSSSGSSRRGRRGRRSSSLAFFAVQGIGLTLHCAELPCGAKGIHGVPGVNAGVGEPLGVAQGLPLLPCAPPPPAPQQP